MFSGRNSDQNYAAQLLGRSGTEDARQALITALTGKDKSLAAVAASALSQMGMTDQVKSALLAAANDDPGVKQQVMQQLVRAGVLKGVRGPRGGYRLAKERRRISVGDVVRIAMSLDENEENFDGGSELGRRVVVPGFPSRLIAALAPLLPRAWLLGRIGARNRDRV